MSDIFAQFPGWAAEMRMPSLSFFMPHWVYWLAVLLFPLIAMIMARRPVKDGPRRYELALGWFIWLVGGFVGLHRFYLRNPWGLLYLPLFVGILTANSLRDDARVAYSNAAIIVKDSQNILEREAPRLEKYRADLTKLEAQENPLKARLRSTQRKIDKSEAALEKARAGLIESGPLADAAAAERQRYERMAFYFFLAILAFLAFDFFAMPFLVRAANRRLEQEPEETELIDAPAAPPMSVAEADYAHVSQGGITNILDRIAYYSGEYVSYWAIIAVFVYFFEVVSRYVFNSPTNWAHEGMFLMLGMQYLICGAYAMLTGSHVRVDIFYANFSRRRKALVDLLTSIFFFIFAGTLMVTGWIFAMDATEVSEISFSEWGIHYWPFKWAIFIGGVLLIIQGVSKFIKDLRAFKEDEPPGSPPGETGANAMREAG